MIVIRWVLYIGARFPPIMVASSAMSEELGSERPLRRRKEDFSAIVLVQFSRATVEKDFRRGELVVGGGLSIMQDVSNEIVNDYFGGLDDAERTAWNRYVVTGRTNGREKCEKQRNSIGDYAISRA